jgi:tetratricopeptide (TPR) repeat protein
LLRPLLVTLIRTKANHRGGLWVLISHKTHSAAQNFVNLMESYTDAIFVGEPTGDNVNMYGDYTYIELPNSHIPVALSTLWWQDKDPRDHRTATYPEIAVPRSFEQLTTGKDPALEIALTEAAPRPLEDLMEEAAAGGAGPLANTYKRFVDDPRHQYAADMEARLNRAGYALLGGGKSAQAVLVFQLCADTHPKSDNAYESLGEGLEAVGDKAAAISAYKQSLQINPSNRDASEAVMRLTASAAQGN